MPATFGLLSGYISTQLGPVPRSTFRGTAEGEGGFHFVADEGGPFFGGGGGGFEDEFVVDLDEEFDFVIGGGGADLGGDFLVDVDHGLFDEVGGTALDDGVEGGAG